MSAEHAAENDAPVRVTITFTADAGVTADEAYDVAEAMVTAAPPECVVLTFEGISTSITPHPAVTGTGVTR